MNDRLVTDADISEAIAWRLSHLAEQEVFQAVANAVECGGDPAVLMQAHPDMGWTTLCAILARAAAPLRDKSLFYRAGFEVVFGYRKAIDAKTRQDALSAAIVKHLVCLPDIEPLTLWREFIRQADDGDRRLIAGYDAASNVICFHPNRKVGYEAFYARFFRIKRKIAASASCN